MLFGGGRILVAAAGAIVLVVVAIYAVRGAWWDPTSKPLTLPAATTTATVTDTSTTSTSAGAGEPGNPSGGEPGGPSDGEGGPSNGHGTSSTTTSQSSTDDSADNAPFTATTKKVNGFLGFVVAEVDLPQVQGGDQKVAEVFNDEMHNALEAQADSVTGGKLEGRPGSGVRIGKRVLSGVLRTSAVDIVKATSRALVSTVVVDAEDGSVITLSALFDDPTKGLKVLADQAKTLGRTGSKGSSFDATKVQPTEEMFGHWTAETGGMHIFFEEGAVAPDAAGIVEVTVPWDDLSDVLNSDVAQVVSS